jgi:probable HAF family extracellular repeat protein
MLGMGSSGASSAVLCPTITDLSKQPGWPAGGVPVAINDSGQIVGNTLTSDGGAHAFVWRQGRVTSLGTLGGKESAATAMNDRGQIVGWSDTKTGGGHYAFLWQNGKMSNLGARGGGWSEATSINDAGQVVGSSSTKSGTHHAVLWQRGKLTDLGTLPGSSDSGASSINNKGQILGQSTTKTGESHVVLWRSEKMIDLGPLGESAAAINDNGQIVGYRHSRAFLWQNGKTTYLHALPGGKNNIAAAINDEGQVVGSSDTRGDAFGSGPSRAFLWQAGRMTDLGTLPGDLYSEAGTINDNGQIVGRSSSTYFSATPHGVLWTLRAMSGHCTVFTPSQSGDSVLVHQNSITVAGSISALGADAGRAILLVDQAGPCANAFVWNRAKRKIVTVLDGRRCAGTLSDESIGPAALAGETAAYISLATGNIQDTSLLLMSLATGHSSRAATESAGGQGAYGTVLADVAGAGGLLVYEDQTLCAEGPDVSPPDVPCPPGVTGGSVVKDQIRLALPVRRVIATADQELTVLAVGGGRVIVGTDAGPVIVLKPERASTGLHVYQGFRAEHLIASYPYGPAEVLAAATDGHTLAVLRANGNAIDVMPLPGSRSIPGQKTLRVHAEDLAGLDGTVLAYTKGDSVYVLDLTTGRSALVAHPKKGLAAAELAHDGLYVASATTVTFTPRSQLDQRLRHP